MGPSPPIGGTGGQSPGLQLADEGTVVLPSEPARLRPAVAREDGQVVVVRPSVPLHRTLARMVTRFAGTFQHAYPNPVVRSKTRRLFEDRTQAAVDGSGRHGAAIDDREGRRALGDNGAEFPGHAIDEAQVDRAIVSGGEATDTRTASASCADAPRSDETRSRWTFSRSD